MGATPSSDYYDDLDKMLSAARSEAELFEIIPNAPFHNKLKTTNIDLGIIVFQLVNPKTQTIDRVTYSKTAPAIEAIKASPLPFKDIKIPVKARNNINAKAIRHAKPYHTSDWQYLFTPTLTKEAARFNQAESGMDCSVVYPLPHVRDGAALIFSFYQPISKIGAKHHDFMKRYSEIVGDYLRAFKPSKRRG